MSSYIAFDLDPLFEKKFLSDLDYHFARSMAKAFNESDPIVLASCALVSKFLFEGHVCVDVSGLSGTLRLISEITGDQVQFPDLNAWTTSLQKSSMVSDTTRTPLVMDDGLCLYFSKYYDFQNRLAKNIAQRICVPAAGMDESMVDGMLASCFTEDSEPIRCQKNAVKAAILNWFTIISGGPGTGKTTVTAVIKKILIDHATTQGQPEPRIMCVAPTGKAASKMDQGSTIHSILKPLKSGPGFFYHRHNLLSTDVMIIDEASMIDIALLTRLLEAVPLTARVIILGDRHQLSSIQAGSVFSDICTVKALSAHIFQLDYNFRSKGKTGIENLSKAINENDAQTLEGILTAGLYPDVVFDPIGDRTLVEATICPHILEGYRSFGLADTIETALDRLDDFKILCAHNSGPYGVLQVNHVCENILRSDRNFAIQDKFFKRMIMVTANDYKKGLFNGDTGIVFEKKEGVNTFFKSTDNTIKHYRASDLFGVDTAFAITIHKSQGSEFETVLIIVPDKLSPVMTRQLLYTGVTRAKTRVIIAGDIHIIKKAIRVSIKRNSGLSTSLEKKIRERNL